MREPLILLLAGFIAFGATLGASFHFDDYALFSDPSITSPSGWWQVWRPMQTRPLTWFTFWVNYRLGGMHPSGYHLVNLALHQAAAVAMWTVLRRLIDTRAALIAAALFAVHPIQTEAVAYVFARATLLMTLFCILSLGAWLRGRRWVAAAWFALALLSKEECAAFPLFLLLLHFTVSGRRSDIPPILAMLAFSIAAAIRVIRALSGVPQATAGFTLDASSYLAAQGWVTLRYVRLLLFPWGFNFDPDIRVQAWQAAIGWLAIAGLAAAAFRRFRRHREGLWILGGMVLLLPSSSFFPAADLAADRRMYLPMLSFACAMALIMRNWWTPALATVGIVLIALSFARAQVWRTEESLWREAVDRSPRKMRPKLQLARVVEPRRALELLGEAKLLAPNDPDVASQVGRTWLQLSRPDRALAEFGRALALAPRDAKALNNRGVALAALGDGHAARQDFERALVVDPCFAEARRNLNQLGIRAETPPQCR